MLVKYPVSLMMAYIKLTWCQDSGNMHDPFAIVITWLALLNYKISLLNVRTVSFSWSKTVLLAQQHCYCYLQRVVPKNHSAHAIAWPLTGVQPNSVWHRLQVAVTSKFSATSIILQRESNSPSKSGCISLTDQILVSFLSSPSMKRQLNFFLRGLDRVILQQLTRHITYIAINNTYTPAVKVPSTSHWIN